MYQNRCPESKSLYHSNIFSTPVWGSGRPFRSAYRVLSSAARSRKSSPRKSITSSSGVMPEYLVKFGSGKSLVDFPVDDAGFFHMTVRFPRRRAGPGAGGGATSVSTSMLPRRRISASDLRTPAERWSGSPGPSSSEPEYPSDASPSGGIRVMTASSPPPSPSMTSRTSFSVSAVCLKQCKIRRHVWWYLYFITEPAKRKYL